MWGRSRCPHCNHALGFRDLVPLVSYIIQHGKCRHCDKAISWRYPLAELSMAGAFIIIYWNMPWSLQTLCVCLATVVLVIMIITDLEELIIPDQAQVALAIIGLGYAYLNYRPIFHVLGGSLISWLIGVLLFYGSQMILKRDGLGWGDVKFFAVAGLFLPIEMLSIFFFLAGVIGLCTALVWRLCGHGNEFPFGPALAVALYLCLVFPLLGKITEFIT